MFNDWVKKFNKDFVEKALTTLNGSLGSLHEKLLEKLTTNYNDTVDGDGYEYEDIKTDEIDIRTGTYYRIKTLYDKNVSYTICNTLATRKKGLKFQLMILLSNNLHRNQPSILY